MGIWLLNLVGAGMMGVLAVSLPGEIAWKYLRLCGTIVLALLAGAAAWSWQGGSWGGSSSQRWATALTALGAASAATFIVAAPWLSQRRALHVALACGAALPALAAAGLWTRLSLPAAGPGAIGLAGIMAGQLLGAALVGSVTAAWLLGHAYLTATKMTISPLRRMSYALGVAALLRFAFGAISIGVALLLVPDSGAAVQLRQFWLPLTMRAGLGLVLPLAGAYMVFDCVRLRSTQSATGILYFLSLFAYVGELSAQYLLTQTGWPT